ncbi:MobF family relaxase [Mycobacterium avium subsp. hominissuis]|uniref:MobF family relaxase n=1 Tax=Mycobacterium avium TaxID=1764 RepID=UPI00044F1735|nr:MobF family relaxase [Mycobacterium avium]ETZ55266.1 AAA domain protein [Mycobacterium avium MAV_120709_2344]MDO2387083.1 MobF family relaxase [Mycobacterium avium subsp. hominissuis]UBU99450.1 relaxase domain-containing protein [Mycobacterium avium subsp. hominissuis]
MIRIDPLGQWSVKYYESTAVRGHEYCGGLSEYYSERDTRAPVMFVVGDQEFAAEKMGVRHGEGIAESDVTTWFNDGIPPAGPGVGKPRPGTYGWDVLLTVPKSVSLLAALAEDPAVSTVVMQCIVDAAQDGLKYMHQHAGYTRVSNPVDPSKKDLQRLPALPFVTYFHHTARPLPDGTCDPHMHIHMLLPGKVARADGRMVTIDSQSMYHEAKPAGMIVQKSLRDRMSAALGAEWADVDPHTGIAELKGFDRELITAFSRRQSVIMDWAREHPGRYADGAIADELADVGAVSSRWAKGEREWLDVAQKATRNKKLESLHYDELREQWINDPRAAGFDARQFLGVVGEAAAREGPGGPPEARDVFEQIGTLKNAWTRADLVEAVVGKWGHGRGVEVVSVDEIEALVDDVIEQGCFQVVADRQPWHREGHVRYTDAITLTREAEVLELCDVKSQHFEITVTQRWFEEKGLRSDAAHAMTELAMSRRMINVLEAPAGSGKTTSLKAFRERTEAQSRHVTLVSASRKALNEARKKEAASHYATIEATRRAIADDRLDWDRNTVVVVDEAAMSGDRDLYELFKAAKAAHAKVILVGDSYQLQPVRRGGGLFRDLSEQLAWTQTLEYVWRQKDVEEKAITLTMRDAQTESEARKVAHWYMRHERLHAGDQRSMADAVVRDYFEAVLDGHDVLVVADKWEKADALNMRIQNIYTLTLERDLGYELPGVPIGHGQEARFNDIIMTLENNWDIEVTPDPDVRTLEREVPIVTNADRWRVLAVHDDGSIEAMRLDDHARAVLPADYAQSNVTLGYVGTIHAAQGANADVGLCIGDADTLRRVQLYPGLTRGSELNKVYLAIKEAGESEHHAQTGTDEPERRVLTDIEAQTLLMEVINRDDRERTALHEAEEAINALIRGEPHVNYADAFGGMDPYVAQLVHTRAHRRSVWASEYAAELAEREAWQHGIETAQERARDVIRDRERARGAGRDIDDYSRDIG